MLSHLPVQVNKRVADWAAARKQSGHSHVLPPVLPVALVGLKERIGLASDPPFLLFGIGSVEVVAANTVIEGLSHNGAISKENCPANPLAIHKDVDDECRSG